MDSSGQQLNPGPLVEAALANPGQTEALEHWLKTHGVPLDYRAEPPRPPDLTTGPPKVYGGFSGLGWTAATFLFVLNVGLLLKKIDRHDRWIHALHAFGGNPGRAMLTKLLQRPAEDLVHHPKSTLLPWSQIHSIVISWHGGHRPEIFVTLVDGTTRRLSSSAEAAIQGQPVEALAHILGDRFTLLNEQQASGHRIGRRKE
jgi:hypothetical protein